MTELNLTMFRAYDIRTPSERLTDELGVRLARAEAMYFREELGVSGILVAHDARSTGPHYLELATEQYRRAGLDVTVIPGVCSTSMFYFTAMKHPRLAAVLFGASHNPAGDTGQKILGPGVRPIAQHIGPEGGLDRIQALYVQGMETVGGSLPGRITVFDPTEDYIQYSMELAGVGPGDLSGLKVFHDYLNGAAGREMMLAFDRAGADLTPLHFTADGRFPLGDPNPVKQEVIRGGMEILKNGDYLFGTFFDGDGDRIDFCRGDGRYLSSSFVYAGILPDIHARFDRDGIGVYADLKCNPLALIEMAKSGMATRIIRNGHSQIKHAMFENTSMVGSVEESAHFYEDFQLDGARYCTENTLYIALLVARIWHKKPVRFDGLFNLQAATCREREWGHKFPSDQQRAEALEAVEAYFIQEGAQAMSRMPDGYELEATIMRRGMPLSIDADSRFDPEWLQVCQRISQSEDGLARWEVVAGMADVAKKAKEDIQNIVEGFDASDEYQG
jgi:phosphomannomutase